MRHAFTTRSTFEVASYQHIIVITSLLKEFISHTLIKSISSRRLQPKQGYGIFYQIHTSTLFQQISDSREEINGHSTKFYYKDWSAPLTLSPPVFVSPRWPPEVPSPPPTASTPATVPETVPVPTAARLVWGGRLQDLFCKQFTNFSLH